MSENESPSGERPKSAKKAADAATRTPFEHAAARKSIKSFRRFLVPKGQRARLDLCPAEHNAAAVLHGWAEHKHHTGEDIKLTDEAYEGALKAAVTPLEGGERHGDYEPHKPALSPYRGKGR